MNRGAAEVAGGEEGGGVVCANLPQFHSAVLLYATSSSVGCEREIVLLKVLFLLFCSSSGVTFAE